MKQRIEIEIYIHTKLWMRIWTICKKIKIKLLIFRQLNEQVKG